MPSATPPSPSPSPSPAPAPSPRPTLLVFTLGAAAETRRRRLLPAALGARERALHAACLDGTLAAGRAAGCRLIVSSPDPGDTPGDGEDLPEVLHLDQPGRSFGERLAGAVARAEELAAGAPLVVVGSDLPDVSADLVGDALERLGDEPERVVLGPSPDGGFYLLAARSPLAHLLSGIAWRRRTTLADLRRRLEAHGFRVELLAPRRDLDHRSDLERWLAGADPRALAAPVARLARQLGRLLADLARGLDAPVAPRPAPVPLPAESPRPPPRPRA